MVARLSERFWRLARAISFPSCCSMKLRQYKPVAGSKLADPEIWTACDAELALCPMSCLQPRRNSHWRLEEPSVEQQKQAHYSPANLIRTQVVKMLVASEERGERGEEKGHCGKSRHEEG